MRPAINHHFCCDGEIRLLSQCLLSGRHASSRRCLRMLPCVLIQMQSGAEGSKSPNGLALKEAGERLYLYPERLNAKQTSAFVVVIRQSEHGGAEVILTHLTPHFLHLSESSMKRGTVLAGDFWAPKFSAVCSCPSGCCSLQRTRSSGGHSRFKN